MFNYTPDREVTGSTFRNEHMDKLVLKVDGKVINENYSEVTDRYFYKNGMLME